MSENGWHFYLTRLKINSGVKKMREKETLDPDSCYAAVKARDSRFDGRFFVGVRSTGIYCRPICSARVPKKENCTFFVSAAAAERAGYRPCLKCRPELAPVDARAPVDAAGRLARRAALLLEENGLADTSLARLAYGFGVTDRHLRRVFFKEFGVSPLQYLQNRRLLLAKGLLTDTALPITEVAFAAGFGSVRRFNDVFQRSYRLSPSALRKNGGEQEGTAGEITLLAGYRPPLRLGRHSRFSGRARHCRRRKGGRGEIFPQRGNGRRREKLSRLADGGEPAEEELPFRNLGEKPAPCIEQNSFPCAEHVRPGLPPGPSV
jgi:methylphosphotriester-DNA--protein-cysteine methyltransferase